MGLAAKADATRSERCTPERLPSRRRYPDGSNTAGVFKRTPTPELIRGGRVGKIRQIKNTDSALGMIQQVKIRQQVRGEITAKRSVAVAAVATDSSHLDRALVEHDVVGLVSVGC